MLTLAIEGRAVFDLLLRDIETSNGSDADLPPPLGHLRLEAGHEAAERVTFTAEELTDLLAAADHEWRGMFLLRPIFTFSDSVSTGGLSGLPPISFRIQTIHGHKKPRISKEKRGL